MLDVIKGPFEGDRFSLPADKIRYSEQYNEIPKKLRICYSFDLGFAKIVQSDIKESVTKAINKFSQLDWSIEKVKIKRTRVAEAFSINWLVTFAYELKPFLKEWKDKMDPNLVKWIEAGLKYEASSLPDAMKIRESFYIELYKVFQNYDILITPTTAITAFELGISAPKTIEGKGVSPTGWQPFTFPFNFTGNPAASIPCGFDPNGLPIGMQIVGKLHDDLKVLQVSNAYEEMAPWQGKKPNIT